MKKEKQSFTRYPVISLSAEYLVMGHLMRRNILTYKAPPNNEGYDLICIHPNPRQNSRQIRVQVKSRLATDCDRGFPVKEKSINAEHESALHEVVSQVEKMFAEHEQQMTEKMMNGMTEQFGEMHNELSGKMQAIEDQLGGFEIQHAAESVQ